MNAPGIVDKYLDMFVASSMLLVYFLTALFKKRETGLVSHLSYKFE